MLKPILFDQVTLKIVSSRAPIVGSNQILVLYLEYVVHVSNRRFS